MSQRECSGLNAPRFSVSAGEDIKVSPERYTTSFSGLALWPCLLLLHPFQSRAEAVGHPARQTASSRFSWCPCWRRSRAFRGLFCRPPRPSGIAFGVGHPEQPLPDVRGARARSAQIGGPDAISQRFQVSSYSGEPLAPSLARNLFSKDDWRSTLFDEEMPVRPEVPLVSSPQAATCRAERLARAGAGPYGRVVAPSGEAQGQGPAADAGEEMELAVSSKLDGSDVTDVPLVDVTGRQLPGGDQVAQPLGAVRVQLVVPDRHPSTPTPIQHPRPTPASPKTTSSAMSQ